MTKFTLTEKTSGKTTIYTYEGDGRTISFNWHPVQAFVPVFVEGDEALLEPIASAYIKAGLKQHDFAGGFDEAIRELEV